MISRPYPLDERLVCSTLQSRFSSAATFAATPQHIISRLVIPHMLHSIKHIAVGEPLPRQAGKHAISVSLPSWSSHIGFKEDDPTVTDRMQTGYPRFWIHWNIRKVRLLFPMPATTNYINMIFDVAITLFRGKVRSGERESSITTIRDSSKGMPHLPGSAGYIFSYTGLRPP